MRVVDHPQMDDYVSRGVHKDSVSLPKPLSISDIVAALDDGAKVRISYKGIPGSYSEDAALKAYPNCETVSCNDFEEAFKAVEIWWADKVILPIENTSGGSIQRNYDLLLCHRLHIVGEAFELSDDFLSKLGVARENVDDTAGAAQIESRPQRNRPLRVVDDSNTPTANVQTCLIQSQKVTQEVRVAPHLYILIWLYF
ncbi:arogenate dehydratase/prephenate dehydratase 2, chloroplastic-like isoform X8 [Glycine soja]|uniref:arogenate dehydratase/prephenate dehydratase 2, chloroplastic-like isoform X8 n=1 Tax=Glycine soja TaxID=3848 RepID=UPI0010398E85|nr:arogenate dehydratase/prephenate dehydratase 2, chloroplastic-like isoform X8 [Glycine soja]